MYSTTLVLGLLAYIALGRFIVRVLRGSVRDFLFATLNVAAVYLSLFYGHHNHYALRFGVYLALVAFQYFALCFFADKKGWVPWLAFAVPIGALIFFRYVPNSAYDYAGHLFHLTWHAAPTMVGISYMAFRASYLVLEIRNGVVKKPTFWQYLGFCLFLPPVPVGPISPYGLHIRAFGAEPPQIPPERAALRILVGFVKYEFLGSLCDRLGYKGLLLDEHPHPWIDLPIAMVFYFLFLYLNFSGFCDMAIGAAGLIGIPVAENFDRPLAARNMREFWNRWHITLSQYMRDVVFAPLSKYLTQRLGPQNINHAIGISVFIVFLLIGIWHGTGWNYAVFGLAQAIGVLTVHYYTIGLKKWLGRDGFKAYNSNPWIRAIAVVITFCYYAATLFFFANTFPEMKAILAGIQ